MNGFMNLLTNKDDYPVFMEAVFQPLHILFVLLFIKIVSDSDQVVIFGYISQSVYPLLALAFISLGIVVYNGINTSLPRKTIELARKYGKWIAAFVLAPIVVLAATTPVLIKAYTSDEMGILALLIILPIIKHGVMSFIEALTKDTR